MKVGTWNVNSIRRRLPLVLDWLAQHQPDALCLHETRVHDDEFPAEAFRSAGYYVTFRGAKAYNGVATITRLAPDSVLHGLHEGCDNEDARILLTVLDGVPTVNTYVPQGYKITSEKYAFKLEWFRRIRRYFDERLLGRTIVLLTMDPQFKVGINLQPFDSCEAQTSFNIQPGGNSATKPHRVCPEGHVCFT